MYEKKNKPGIYTHISSFLFPLPTTFSFSGNKANHINQSSFFPFPPTPYIHNLKPYISPLVGNSGVKIATSLQPNGKASSAIFSSKSFFKSSACLVKVSLIPPPPPLKTYLPLLLFFLFSQALLLLSCVEADFPCGQRGARFGRGGWRRFLHCCCYGCWKNVGLDFFLFFCFLFCFWEYNCMDIERV